MQKRHNLLMTVLSMTVGLSLLTGCNSQVKNVTTSQGTQESMKENTEEKGQENVQLSIKNEIEDRISVSYKEEDYHAEWKNAGYTSIKLNETEVYIEGNGAHYSEQILTITQAGTYVIEGSLNEGNIIIDSNDEEVVRLVLNGVNVHSSNTAPVYVKNAKKVVLSLEEGTENIFSDEIYTLEETEEQPDAVIYSKDDLVINGTGSLKIQANTKDGIVSKDKLKIMEGNISIVSANDGIKGKDLVAIKDVNIEITAGGDGIKSTNDTEQDKGFVNIEAGLFDITAEHDGIQAETNVQIDGGEFKIITHEGSDNGKTHTAQNFAEKGNRDNMGQRMIKPLDEGMTKPSDEGTIKPEDEGMTRPENEGNTVVDKTQMEEVNSESYKGVKAGKHIIITNGKMTLNTADDSIHSNDKLVITDGEIAIDSGDDGIHADGTIEISGGNIVIYKSYEGIESSNMTLSGGEISVVASDDGINIGGGNDGSAMERLGENSFSEEGIERMLTITGGSITVDAAGDGLDSNGSINMTGGHVVVYGPANGGNGALDYDKEFLISGGTLIAAGSAGMLQATSENSTQNTIVMTFSEGAQEAGTNVVLSDANGKEIIRIEPTKIYQSVIISSPDIISGDSYTLSYGESKSSELTVSSVLTYLNESGITTMPQTNVGGKGGRLGNHKDKSNEERKKQLVEEA